MTKRKIIDLLSSLEDDTEVFLVDSEGVSLEISPIVLEKSDKFIALQLVRAVTPSMETLLTEMDSLKTTTDLALPVVPLE